MWYFLLFACFWCLGCVQGWPGVAKGMWMDSPWVCGSCQSEACPKDSGWCKSFGTIYYSYFYQWVYAIQRCNGYWSFFSSDSQRGYRVKLDEQKYTTPIERIDFVRSKNAADVLNEVSNKIYFIQPCNHTKENSNDKVRKLQNCN